MFRKILIANRGEIACRIIETARRMGVATVAVYSDVDVGAKHVAMANEAVRIGPAPVAKSYLLGDVIIAAALDCGAEAIHPGYGFLSENPDFVEAVEAAGLVFIGPSADAIRAMGLKDAAKKLMEKANVPVVPGYHGENQDADFLAMQAEKIGYPVLIKAVAGGGGKGMRRVDHHADFADALHAARREGSASFGNSDVLVEKYVTAPRHIEVQIFGDNHGNVVHLFERDCSLQRRHQKVIEEAPAPGMTAEMRAAMTSAAVKAAQSIGYSGAGTVEFIVDGSDGLRPDAFWFMEMNTRLQVEHPVTEAITGLDLVEWQLRVASGQPLPLAQDDIALNGHAFEARIYAEDVPAGFLPSTGTLERLRFPNGVRVDSGVRQGDEISPWYDPMIAKLTSHAATRKIALAEMRVALEQLDITGTITNTTFLAALCRHKGFGDEQVDTGLIVRDLAGLIAVPEAPFLAEALAAIVALGLPNDNIHSGFSIWGALVRIVVLDDVEYRVATLGENRFTVCCDDSTIAVDILAIDGPDWRFLVAGKMQSAMVWRSNDMAFARLGLTGVAFSIQDPMQEAGGAQAGGDVVLAPMPGLVQRVMISVGDVVKQGDPLMVLEAMKMEHTLSAPRDGVVELVLAVQGAQVDAGALLLRLKQEET